MAKLSRLLLTDSNSHAIGQAIACEHVRLGRLYGPYRASEISKEVRDTIYTRSDQAAYHRAEAKLANNAFDLGCGYPPGPNPPPITDDSGH